MIEKFQKEGVKAVKLPDAVLRAFQKASDEVMAEESAKDPMFKKVYDSQRAFQKQHQIWKDLGYLPRNWQ